MDAFRSLHPGAGHYTFWDYFGSWERNNGIRIDHILLSPQAADRLSRLLASTEEVRGAAEKPSDHVPVWCELAIWNGAFEARLPLLPPQSQL